MVMEAQRVSETVVNSILTRIVRQDFIAFSRRERSTYAEISFGGGKVIPGGYRKLHKNFIISTLCLNIIRVNKTRKIKWTKRYRHRWKGNYGKYLSELLYAIIIL
jgi:hypothetical protein